MAKHAWFPCQVCDKKYRVDTIVTTGYTESVSMECTIFTLCAEEGVDFSCRQCLEQVDGKYLRLRHITCKVSNKKCIYIFLYNVH